MLALLLMLIPATMTTYINSDATTVYVITSSEPELSIEMAEGTIQYCATDKGDAECSWSNGTLVLRGGDGVSIYVVKVSRAAPPGQFTYYNRALNVSKHEIYLPEGAKVYEIYPEAVGNNPYVWHASSPIYSVRYGTGQLEWWVYAFAFAVVVLAAVIYYYFFMQKRNEPVLHKNDEFGKVLQSLPKYERDVLSAVAENPGIRQNELQAKLSLQKAHLSKLLSRLEARFLLRRERIGRNVKVYLGEFFTKKP